MSVCAGRSGVHKACGDDAAVVEDKEISLAEE